MNTNTSPWANPPPRPPEDPATSALRKVARSPRAHEALGVIIPRLKLLMTKPDEIFEGDTYVDDRCETLFRVLTYERQYNGLSLFFADMVAGTYFCVSAPPEKRRKITGYFNYVGETSDPDELRRRWVERPTSDSVKIMSWKRGEWEERLF